MHCSFHALHCRRICFVFIALVKRSKALPGRPRANLGVILIQFDRIGFVWYAFSRFWIYTLEHRFDFRISQFLSMWQCLDGKLANRFDLIPNTIFNGWNDQMCTCTSHTQNIFSIVNSNLAEIIICRVGCCCWCWCTWNILVENIHNKSFNQEPLQSNIPFVALSSSKLQDEQSSSFFVAFFSSALFKYFI